MSILIFVVHLKNIISSLSVVLLRSHKPRCSVIVSVIKLSFYFSFNDEDLSGNTKVALIQLLVFHQYFALFIIIMLGCNKS